VEELLRRVKTAAVGAQQHQDLPFEQVVELVQPTRSLAQHPVFQVMLAWQNTSLGEWSFSELGALPLNFLAPPALLAQFHLSLNLQPSGARVVGRIEYATSLFHRAAIERHAGYLRTVLAAMVADDQQRSTERSLLSREERKLVLEEWNATAAPYPNERCVQELVEAQVARTPNAIAVMEGGKPMTYAELDTRASHLARQLCALGVGVETPVALCLERSAELIIAMFGVLKAGGAYVPLDPNTPADRLAFMLTDSGSTVVVTRATQLFPAVANQYRFDIDRALIEPAPMDSAPRTTARTSATAAYVIYTSGSTGRPKGVVVPHYAVTRLLWQPAFRAWGAADRVAFTGNPAFDISTLEVWGPLVAGACVVVIPAVTLLSPRAFAVALAKASVTVVHLTPRLLAECIRQEGGSALGGVRTLLTGGDRVDVEALRRVMAQAAAEEVVHCYGPTETTLFATTHLLTTDDISSSSVPIGRPIENTRAYVVDAQGEPVPIGVAGEMYVGGAGVARGYLRQPALTAARFVPDRFGPPGSRLYRTGDRCRWRADGQLEFLGRMDFQIKLLGNRVELGEIEAVLSAHPAVQTVVVVARANGGESQLVAYFASAAEAIDVDSLRTFLNERLPRHMVPAAYVRLASLPLTPNGKVDRKALPEPDETAHAARGYEAPEGEMESKVAALWQELLQVERVGRRDDFFALGGHSLLAVRLIDEMRKCGLTADVRTLFGAPMLADFARAADEIAEIRL
jgi:amino acid adenylation domain-containing protein